MNRKQRRAMEKKVGKENSQKLAEKIFQFDQLPDECLACTTPFDKKNPCQTNQQTTFLL